MGASAPFFSGGVMDIEKLIEREITENNRASAYYAKLMREAHNKYAQLNAYDLQNHKCRLQQEINLFGSSFRTLAGIVVIENLLSERGTA